MILSIETGGDICSVALSEKDELISLRESDIGRNQAQNVAVFINEIFRENHINGDDLSAVAISKGPGSYTGLRIGVSVAKGLCYGANKPLIAIGSLDILTASAIEDFEAGILGIETLDDSILCPMIDARRMEVYEQLFSPCGEAISQVKPHIITENSFLEYKNQKQFIIFGSGADKCSDTLKVKGLTLVNVAQSARGMVKKAYEKYTLGLFEDIAYFEPLYLKEFVAGMPKKLL
ncbi:MAG: tRNA (adenosine(37)-N6)-threonylcarbamoyltransferase complex dimerization subunit type 1 TsaB [Rikenellaceae bacterium]